MGGLVLTCTALLVPLALAQTEGPQGADDAQAPPTARLIYRPGTEAANCPTAEALGDSVAAKLGYYPFRPSGKMAVTARVLRCPEGLCGRIELRDGEGKLSGSRTLSTQGDCEELIESMAFAISLGLDPLQLHRLAATNASSSAAPSASSAEPTPAPPPTPRRRHVPTRPSDEPLRVRAALALHWAWGVAPDAAFGATAQAGLRWPNLSLAFEGRADQTSRSELKGSDVETSLLAVGLLPCGHMGPLSACGIGYVGSLQASGSGLDEPSRDRALFAAAGARVAVDVPVGDAFFMTGRVDVLGVLTHATYHIDEQPAWTSPPLSTALGLGMGRNF